MIAIALDIETGGLVPGVHPVLSIAACVVTAYGVLPDRAFFQHVRPGDLGVDPAALRVQGEDPDTWEPPADAVPIGHALDHLGAWILRSRMTHGFPGSRILPAIAHHAAFDSAHLCLAQYRARPQWGYDLPGLRFTCTQTLLREMADAGLVACQGTTLADLARLVGFDDEEIAARHHDPLWDALACGAGWLHLRRLLRAATDLAAPAPDA